MAEKQGYLNDQDVKNFIKEIQQYNLGPLWEAILKLMNKTPVLHAVAYLWSGELLKKKLLEAAYTIVEGERIFMQEGD
jgi:gentisate 1,2-dioxygenase